MIVLVLIWVDSAAHEEVMTCLNSCSRVKVALKCKLARVLSREEHNESFLILNIN